MGFMQGWGGLLLIEGSVLTVTMQMATVHNLEEEHVKAMTSSISVSFAACAATTGTTLVIGYAKTHFTREIEFFVTS
jgi:coenzyme F420-reducing hydrogenase gamma subunit